METAGLLFSNDRGFNYVYSFSPNHLKTRPFEIWTFLSGFQMVFTKWQPFVQISNGQASGFQIPFDIWAIGNPTSFPPFIIQTSLDSDTHSLCYEILTVDNDLFVH